MSKPKRKREPVTFERAVALLNGSFAKGKNPSITRLSSGDVGGKITRFNEEEMTMTMQFVCSQDFCKETDILEVLEAFAGSCMDVSMTSIRENCNCVMVSRHLWLSWWCVTLT